MLKLGSDSKGKYIASVALVILGVFFDVILFLPEAKMILALMAGNCELICYGRLCLLAYLFILDWRLALLTLAVVPLGIIFISTMGKKYPAMYQESVRSPKHMNDTLVQYVNGTEVIKAFNQAGSSYQKYVDAVVDHASFFYHWMKSCQWPMSCYTAICPSTLLTVLPLAASSI